MTLHSFSPIKIQPELSHRKSLWIQVCPRCQWERNITYAQAWNINKGNSTRECRSCNIELGITNKNIPPRSRKGPSKGSPTGSKEYLYIRNAFLGPYIPTKADKEKMRKAKLGKRGPLSNRWEGGKTSISSRFYSSAMWDSIRKRVFKRDAYTCVSCGTVGARLNAHHMARYSRHPELCYDMSLCITLCESCHNKVTHAKL